MLAKADATRLRRFRDGHTARSAGHNSPRGGVSVRRATRRARNGSLVYDCEHRDPYVTYAQEMDHEEAREFVQAWLQAWNAHDLEAVLSHFAEDVTFASPVAARILEGSDGVVRGRAALRDYWREGLRRIPDLHFDLVGIYVGIDTIVINYRNQNGGLVNEVLKFDGPLVVEGHGTYLGQGSSPGA
jgi:hypothetical protein